MVFITTLINNLPTFMQALLLTLELAAVSILLATVPGNAASGADIYYLLWFGADAAADWLFLGGDWRTVYGRLRGAEPERGCLHGGDYSWRYRGCGSRTDGSSQESGTFLCDHHAKGGAAAGIYYDASIHD